MNEQDIFKNFLKEIETAVSQNTYIVWFNDLVLISIEKNIVKIKVPMKIHKRILSDTYNNLIESTFFSITGKNYTFDYLTDEDIKEVEPLIEPLIEDKKEESIINWTTNLKEDLTFDNYIVGDSNRLAFIAAKAVAESPGTIHNPLFIYGKSGLGKTHLLHAIGNYIVNHSNKRVLYTTSNDFKNDYAGIASVDKGINTINYANEFKNKYRNVDVLIIDDIQFLVGAERTQQEFFYTFEALHQANKQIIITSDQSPDDLKKIEERLVSRFRWGLPVDIYPPDYNLRCEIVKQKLMQKGSNLYNIIDNEVIEYIANNCPNDIRHIEGTVNRLLAYTAMMAPKKVNLEFAIEALKDFVNKNVYVNNSIGSIQKAVADYYHITIEDLKSKKKNNKIAKPRQIAMYLCRMETDENLAKIGLEFGGRSHSTVIIACEKTKNELQNDEKLVMMLKDIKELL